MSENFITLFNYNYLPQGLSLYYSLKKNLPEANIWVVCMDKKVEADLKKRNLPDLNIIPLKKIENNRLLKVKKTRKFVEYCWTLTPFLPEFFFKKFNKTKSVTYLDADIFFYKSPIPIIKEFDKSKKSILLTEHGFHHKHDNSIVSGKFCVQYMKFKNNKFTKKILRWWQDKCIEWCHDFPNKGRFGDQKYLDLWPKLFPKYIHISKNKKFFQAPWTFDRFNSKDTIIYHFHGLKIQSFKVIVFNNYGLTKKIVKNIYLPYLKALKNSLNKINHDFKQITTKKKLSVNIKEFVRFKLLRKKNLYKFEFNLQEYEKNKK
jgi:hypothetical protein